jgi:hypothetical protein
MATTSNSADQPGTSAFGLEPPSGPRAPLDAPHVLVRPRWEYKHLVRLPSVEAASEENELTRLGGAGWELVNAVFDGRMVHLYLKREVG